MKREQLSVKTQNVHLKLLGKICLKKIKISILKPRNILALLVHLIMKNSNSIKNYFAMVSFILN